MILNVRSCICQKESPESRPLFYGSCHGVLCILLEVRSQQRWAVLQYCDKKNCILGNVVKEGGNSWEETVVENSLVKMEKKSEIFFCKKIFCTENCYCPRIVLILTSVHFDLWNLNHKLLVSQSKNCGVFVCVFWFGFIIISAAVQSLCPGETTWYVTKWMKNQANQGRIKGLIG